MVPFKPSLDCSESKGAGAFVGAGQMVDSAGRIICYKEPEEVCWKDCFAGLSRDFSCNPPAFSRESVGKSAALSMNTSLHDGRRFMAGAKEARYTM
jgi:hypothetical protein